MVPENNARARLKYATAIRAIGWSLIMLGAVVVFGVGDGGRLFAVSLLQ